MQPRIIQSTRLQKTLYEWQPDLVEVGNENDSTYFGKVNF